MKHTLRTHERAATVAVVVAAIWLGAAPGQCDDRQAAFRLLADARDILVHYKPEGSEGKLYRGEALGDVADAYATLGDVDSAAEVIAIIENDPDVDVCAQRAAMQVALADARRGRIAEALRSIDAIEGGRRMTGRREIAKLQVANGDVAGAIETCEGITANRRRASQFLTDVAAVAQESGDDDGAQTALDAALRILELPLAAIDEVDALEEIAVAYARLGKNEKSRLVLQRATDRAKQAHRLSEWADNIAASFANAGFFDDALNMAEQGDPHDSDFFTGGRAIDSTYGRIGVAAAKLGKRDVARRVSARIERGAIKARVIANIATALWQAGEEAESRSAYQQAADLMNESKGKASDFEMIFACDALVDARLIRGEFSEAVAVTDQMPRLGARRDVLRKIAVAQVGAGDLSAALTTAKAIDHTDHRAMALQSIVTAEARSGGISLFNHLVDSEQNPIVRARIMVARAVALQGGFSGPRKSTAR